MRLEEEIKQKSFKTPQHKLGVNIIYSHNWLMAQHQMLFKGSKLTIQQYNVLRILRGQHPKPSTLKMIKERMLDKMSDASRIVDKLVGKKLVSRTQCPDDRRSINLIISDKGLLALKKFDVVDERNKEVFKNLSPREIKELNEMLDKMRG